MNEEDQLEESKDSPEPKPSRRLPCRMIERGGKLSLVEVYDENDWERAYVPTEAVQGDEIAEDAFQAGTPYGVLWEEYLEDVAIPASEIGGELRRRGIWTLEDIALNRQVAVRCLVAAVTPAMNEMIRAAREDLEE